MLVRPGSSKNSKIQLEESGVDRGDTLPGLVPGCQVLIFGGGGSYLSTGGMSKELSDPSQLNGVDANCSAGH